MIKLDRKFLVAALTVIVFVIGMSSNVSAVPIRVNALFSFIGPLSKININDFIDAADAADPDHHYPNIIEDCWPPDPIEELRDDIISKIFDVSETSWFLVKSEKTWYVYYVGNIDELLWISPDGKGALSSYCSIPEPTVMWLLGTAMIVLGLLGRKRKEI